MTSRQSAIKTVTTKAMMDGASPPKRRKEKRMRRSQKQSHPVLVKLLFEDDWGKMPRKNQIRVQSALMRLILGGKIGGKK